MCKTCFFGGNVIHVVGRRFYPYSTILSLQIDVTSGSSVAKSCAELNIVGVAWRNCMEKLKFLSLVIRTKVERVKCLELVDVRLSALTNYTQVKRLCIALHDTTIVIPSFYFIRLLFHQIFRVSWSSFFLFRFSSNVRKRQIHSCNSRTTKVGQG